MSVLRAATPLFARASRQALARTAAPVFRANQHARMFSTTMVAREMRYAKSHEYCNLEGDVATIGISDHAQSALGDVVYVEIPESGDPLKVGKGFSAVESVKAASDIYAPMSGEIVEVNSELDGNPQFLNEDAEGKGWICKIKISDKSEFEKLMNKAAYDKFVEESH
ncbi:glycine cleavage H-protein-domain-containing protein [Baffinella frigidus]|nr:glycine cleavage H-protein-domain-containing protein [Cryptophyta sp. CCMP2293]